MREVIPPSIHRVSPDDPLLMDLVPDKPPIKGLLRRFLEAQATDMTFLADMLDFVNGQLKDPHSSVGPSHFLVKDPGALNEEVARRIWNHSVLPALSDRFFDQPEEHAKFSYEAIRNQADSQNDQEAEDDDNDVQETDVY